MKSFLYLRKTEKQDVRYFQANVCRQLCILYLNEKVYLVKIGPSLVGSSLHMYSISKNYLNLL